MATGILTGTAIRGHRLRLGLRQSELARRAGISASYYNQIERDRRRIGGKLLSDIAGVLGVNVADLADGPGSGLIDALHRAVGPQADMAMAAPTDAAEAFAGRFPNWARLLVRRHAQVLELEALVDTLTDRLTHDRALGDVLHEVMSAVTAIRTSASILADHPDLDANWRNRFQRNIIEDSGRLALGAQALADHLDAEAEGAATTLSPRDEADAFLDRHAHHFPELDAGGPAAAAELVEAQTSTMSSEGRAHLGRLLTVMERDAARTPLPRIAIALAEHGMDPVAIARMLEVDLATVLRRLATLPEGMLKGPVGLLICDASGTFVRRRAVPGFAVPRRGGPCAIWPLFGAMSQPFRPILRVLRQSGDARGAVLTWSVAAPTAIPAPGEDLQTLSHMLIVPLQSWTGGLGGAEGPLHDVGTTCRLCHVADCTARREPSVMSGPHAD